MKNKTKYLQLTFIIISFLILSSSLIFAESDNGNPAVARLNFEVRVAGNLHLRIGSAGATIDEVKISCYSDLKIQANDRRIPVITFCKNEA